MKAPSKTLSIKPSLVVTCIWIFRLDDKWPFSHLESPKGEQYGTDPYRIMGIPFDQTYPPLVI
jgi:hypothetical protein